MRTPELPTHALRAAFEELVELSGAARHVKLEALNLPSEEALRLQAMLIFDDVANCPPETREREMARMGLSPQMKKRLAGMLRTDAEVPQLLAAAAAETLASSGASDDVEPDFQNRPSRTDPPSRWHRTKKSVAQRWVLVVVSSALVCVAMLLLAEFK